MAKASGQPLLHLRHWKQRETLSPLRASTAARSPDSGRTGEVPGGEGIIAK
jgi:hypothetical protein